MVHAKSFQFRFNVQRSDLIWTDALLGPDGQDHFGHVLWHQLSLRGPQRRQVRANGATDTAALSSTDRPAYGAAHSFTESPTDVLAHRTAGASSDWATHPAAFVGTEPGACQPTDGGAVPPPHARAVGPGPGQS